MLGTLEYLDQHALVGAADDLAVADAPGVVVHLHAVAQRDARHVLHEQQAAARGRRHAIFAFFHFVSPSALTALVGWVYSVRRLSKATCISSELALRRARSSLACAVL